MRHGKKFNHLGRKKSHRDAMLSNMACSLIEHKRINTTVAKAKALKLYVEPLITKSKNDTTHSRRTTFSYLKNKEAVSELFKEIAPKVANRPGGYTRIIRLGNRLGDNAEMCMIELVDFNELLLNASGDAGAKKTRRSRRGGGSKTTPAATSQATSDATEPQDTAVVENVVEEVKAPEETTKEGEKKAQPEAEVKDEPAAEEKQEKENTPKAEEKKDENESSTESGEEEENKEEK